jgi:hypothetical protein
MASEAYVTVRVMLAGAWKIFQKSLQWRAGIIRRRDCDGQDEKQFSLCGKC